MKAMKETITPRDERKPSKVPEFVWHIPFYLFCIAVVYVAVTRWIPAFIDFFK